MATAKDATTSDVPSRLLPLVEGFKRLHNSEYFSDLVIKCEGREWKVHRFCVFAHSEFFQAALKGGFKEAEDKKIDLDHEPELVEAMIHYCYTFDYPASTDTEAVSPIVWDVRVYATADKYLVDGLKDWAAHKFKERAKIEWQTQHFANAVAEIYGMSQSQSKQLRDTVLDVVVAHGELMDATDAMSGPFQKALRGTAELGADMCLKLMSGVVKEYKCPGCGTTFLCTPKATGRFGCSRRCYSEFASFWAGREVKR